VRQKTRRRVSNLNFKIFQLRKPVIFESCATRIYLDIRITPTDTKFATHITVVRAVDELKLLNILPVHRNDYSVLALTLITVLS